MNVYLPSLLIISLITTLLISCASNIAQNPQEWPVATKLKKDSCVDLSGIYINQGIDAPSNRDVAYHEAPYLSELLVPYIPSREFVEHKWANQVELIGAKNGKLIIILKKNNTEIFKKKLNENTEFTCSLRGLVIKGRSSPENMMGMTERFMKTTFTKAVDGSILVSDQEIDIGTIIFVPYTWNTIQNYRFLSTNSFQ